MTSGEAVLDANGVLSSIARIMVDLTSTIYSETEQAARDAVAAAVRTRGVFERARGLLMGRLSIGADAAFALLSVHSNHTNMKLTVIASQLVGLTDDPLNAGALTTLLQDLQRHSLVPPAVHREKAKPADTA